jgi:Ca2+-binding EF-hand superfamily protein
MRTVRAVGIGLALLAGGACIALAQNAGGINFAELFQQLDANGDMVIDRGEVPDSGRAAFDQLLKNADNNKDGKIDREEYRDMLLSLRNSFGSISGRFAEIDKNGDGEISKEEFSGPEPLFARIDADGNGVITKEEAARFQSAQGAGAGMMAQRILGMDRNGDGKVSRDEFTGVPGNFDRLDINKDGFITRNELTGAVGAGPGTRAGTPNRALLRERLQAMDKDGDGKVSREEYTGEPALFDRHDTNKDGFISREDNPGSSTN